MLCELYNSESFFMIHYCIFMIKMWCSAVCSAVMNSPDKWETKFVSMWNMNSEFYVTAFQDFLGQMFCTLGEIVGSQGSRLEKSIV